MRDVKLVQQIVDDRLLLVFIAFDEFDHGAEILLNAEASENRRFLRQIADAQTCALIHGKIRNVRAVDKDTTAIGGDQPGDHVKTGCFAGAVRAEEADYFAAFDAHGNAAHDRPALE